MSNAEDRAFELLAIAEKQQLEIQAELAAIQHLSLIHISEPTRLLSISYAVFCLKKKTINTRQLIKAIDEI